MQLCFLFLEHESNPILVSGQFDTRDTGSHLALKHFLQPSAVMPSAMTPPATGAKSNKSP